jgi:WASH complex subunit FAM21
MHRYIFTLTTHDHQLYHYLEEFSSKLLARTKDIETQVDSLVFETKATHVRVHNTFNEFLMLANKQFVENVSSA